MIRLMSIVMVLLLTSGCSKAISNPYICVGPDLKAQKNQNVDKSFKDKFKKPKGPKPAKPQVKVIEAKPKCVMLPKSDRFTSYQARAISSNLLVLGINGYAKYGLVFKKGTLKSRSPIISFNARMLCEGKPHYVLIDGVPTEVRRIWDVKKNQRGSTKPMFGFMEV